MARNEINLLQRVSGKEHLPTFVESCEDALMSKVYIIMEDAGSQSLDALVHEHSHGLPIGLCKDLFGQLCSAVHTLHDLRICHRDLKPDNLLLRPLNDGYYLTLVDFNVACDLSEK